MYKQSSHCTVQQCVNIHKCGRFWGSVCRPSSTAPSLQQVSQLVLQVFGVFHTGGQTGNSSQFPFRASCWNTCVNCLSLFRLTFSGWPPAFRSDRQTDRDSFTLIYCKDPRQYIVLTHTHWYCKCVVMMDIFLRLWKTGEAMMMRLTTAKGGNALEKECNVLGGC